MPLPSTDFDPTESAVPWHVLSDGGLTITFSTPDGLPGEADPRMVDGRGLGPWRALLPATKRARALYEEMRASDAFNAPIRWSDITPSDYDAIVLPGGHAPGMRTYLESQLLQTVVADFVSRGAPVGAICHGVVLLSRARVGDVSVLRGRRVTALLKSQELLAWGMTRIWLGDYYRTYPTTVEDEVRAAVGEDGTFLAGPAAILRDDPDHLERGFVVRDQNLLTARWPGDAHRFATDLLKLLATR